MPKTLKLGSRRRSIVPATPVQSRGLSRPPLERMMRLHRALLANDFPNCQKFSRELEVSAKTVQRDIDFMRDRLGLPIEYSQLEFGYYYTEPVSHFPSFEISEGELVALFVARKALQQYKGTPYEKALRTAFDKICKGLTDEINFGWRDMEDSISFRGIGAADADLQLFEQLSTAVHQRREVEFGYQKLGASRHEQRKVQPYHLAWVDNQWYLFGMDLARQQLRCFALPRMRGAKLTAFKFTRPADFNVSEFLGGSFGVFRGKGKHRIRIEFDAFASRLVAERKWHESQKIVRSTAETMVIELTLSSLEEIKRWILSWGVHATVLEPPELIEWVRESALEIAKAHGFCETRS